MAMIIIFQLCGVLGFWGIDYPVVMAIVMIIGVGIVIMNIVADVMYGVLDPRVRYD